MMRLTFRKAVVNVIAILIGFVLNGQAELDDRRFIGAAQLPLEGLSANEFVPRSWMIEKRLSGDLNADDITDTVLQLLEKDGTTDGERYRALVVLVGSKDGKLRRIAVADRLLADFHSGGMKCGTDGENLTVQVTGKGVIVVSQCLGGADLIHYTQRFKYAANLRRIVLIGQETENGSPPNQITVTSTNYLTRVRITKRFDEKHPKGIVRRSKTQANRRYFFETMDYEDFPN